jgi:predicted deacylase
MAFGLPHVLAISKPVQPAKGLSSYAAAAEKGIPAVLAEAGGVGQMQEDAVAILSHGVINVMRHLEMLESVDDATATANGEARMTNEQTSPKSKIQKIAGSNMATTLLTNFEWLYTKSTGVWYPKVAPGDAVREGEQIGRVGDLFGDTLEEIVSPVNGVVLFLTINPSVLENGLLMGIGAE